MPRSILFLFLLAALASCGPSDPEPSGSTVVVSAVDTLVTVESAALGWVRDLEVAPSGVVFAADMQANQIFGVDPRTGDTLRFGSPGPGPGELKGPSAIRALDEGVLVVEQGNARLQHLTMSGTHVSARPIPSMVARGAPFLLADGGLVAASQGRDSSLAVVFDSALVAVRHVGQPLAPPSRNLDFGVIKATIREGEIPAAFRNDALVAMDSAGGVWVALQTEGEVRRYDAHSDLVWSSEIRAPELAATLADFFRINLAEKDPLRLLPLTYFRDVAVVGQELWLLLSADPEAPAVIIVLKPDGEAAWRIEVRGGGGATQLAIDPSRKLLFLSTYEAQLLAAQLPSEVLTGR